MAIYLWINKQITNIATALLGIGVCLLGKPVHTLDTLSLAGFKVK